MRWHGASAKARLASVLRIQPAFSRMGSASLVFLSADERLLAVARDEGLVTDNPSLHPEASHSHAGT